ncbi:MAG: beta-glucanase [Armatimonadetes bacterium 55-13]|nr:glycoside hydrolase family 16 protein [Armatimonadota bacterium]ODU53691.1 MAG: beta-glucanase [bacterium SCN 57-13]OJU61846.1 MAG: beta-glucanase [Armatimonadetes bacterium 55-13]
MLGLILPALFAPSPQAPSLAGYKLAWSDEFDKGSKPNPDDWIYEEGFVRNKELQWYQSDNARIENGKLIIEGRKERVKNPNYDPKSDNWKLNREFAEYTSACVKTRGKHAWKYGRFEIRAKIQAEKGLWPAIWTLGVDGPWPSNGEIDILEYYADHILANTAYGTGGGVWKTVRTPYSKFLAKDKDWDKSYHTWRMDWDENSIKLYLDDELYNETDVTQTVNPDGKNPFRQPHYILLNLAIGSSGGDPSKVNFPTQYEIDYVRVYQKAE